MYMVNLLLSVRTYAVPLAHKLLRSVYFLFVVLPSYYPVLHHNMLPEELSEQPSNPPPDRTSQSL